MQLSLRLSAIADMVTTGNRLVDVGCDHGYLPVYLIQQKKIPSAIAMDVRKGPLSRAKEHIRQYGLEEYIQARLSDGLENLKAGEGDTLVIAGMGGPLMERILTDGQSVRDSFSEMILQPQSDIPHFRRFIQSQGFQIVEEKMVEEEGKFYPMMRVVRTCPEGDGNENLVSEAAPYTLEEAFGKFLLKEHNPVLYRYLLREERIRADILKQLQAAPQAEAVTARIREVKEEAQLIKAALAEYESK
ncbi:tRNA (adenine(22)-N(1))-methyltransferase [uncultured Blautia sp.]|uniref:tRNA (adenine(22)-N(1))-methyltransferase n=1 Tax=Blautia TaxID=572511 RepID=UPI000823304E|nr:MULTISPECIES: class I SAM-dependent methyltransferase [Blautia]MCU6775637.1 class I SAM-dependent methyltransferase [Blautia acetigignens]NSL02967.1 SAM-dependent methyltransferase [Blautia glucerasea]SCH86199.1 tRNA (adenine(22)-N(1))-methyltransferase [uncultured Blautia sp.]